MMTKRKWKITIVSFLTLLFMISIGPNATAKSKGYSDPPYLYVYGTTLINNNASMEDCWCEFSYRFYKKEKGKWKRIYTEVDRTPEQTEYWEVTKPGTYAMSIKNISVPGYFNESKKVKFTIKQKSYVKMKKLFYRHQKGTDIIMTDVTKKGSKHSSTFSVAKKDAKVKIDLYGVSDTTRKLIYLKPIPLKKHGAKTYRVTVNYKPYQTLGGDDVVINRHRYDHYIISVKKNGKELYHSVVTPNIWNGNPMKAHYGLTNARLK